MADEVTGPRTVVRSGGSSPVLVPMDAELAKVGRPPAVTATAAGPDPHWTGTNPTRKEPTMRADDANFDAAYNKPGRVDRWVDGPGQAR